MASTVIYKSATLPNRLLTLFQGYLTTQGYSFGYLTSVISVFSIFSQHQQSHKTQFTSMYLQFYKACRAMPDDQWICILADFALIVVQTPTPSIVWLNVLVLSNPCPCTPSPCKCHYQWSSLNTTPFLKSIYKNETA